MEALPDLVYDNLVKFLRPHDLCFLSACSLKLYHHCNNNNVWFHHCLVRNWIKFGMEDNSLEHLPSSVTKSMTNISGTSPFFSLVDLDHNAPELIRLPPVCKWHQVFLRSHHLFQNWRQGRYIVSGFLRGHEVGKITALDCNKEIIVSGGSDGVICSWSLQNLILLQSTQLHESICCLHLMDDNRLFVGFESGEVFMLDTDYFKLVTTFPTHSSEVIFIEVVGNMLLSVSSDIHLWDLNKDQSIWRIQSHQTDISCVRLYRNLFVATGSWDSSLVLWDLQLGEQIRNYVGHSEAVSCIEFSDDQLVTGSHDGTLRTWFLDSEEVNKTMIGHREVYSLKICVDLIISGGSESSVRVWSWSGECLQVMLGHIGIVRFLHVLHGSHDNRLVLSAGDVRQIILWNPNDGVQLAKLYRNPSQIGLWKISEAAIVLASPSQPGTISVISFW